MEKDILQLLINGSVNTIIGVFVVMGCYWSFKLFFDKQLENEKSELLKDIEQYKANLEIEKKKFMVEIERDKQRFQAEVDRQLAEHNVLFSTLNNERVRVSNVLFGHLVNLMGMGKAYTSLFKTVPLDMGYEDFEKKQLEDFLNEYSLFWALYSPNRLYFSDDLSSKVFNLGSEILRNVNEHAFKKSVDFEGFGDEKLKVIKENFDKIVALESCMKDIENELRKILGVRG